MCGGRKKGERERKGIEIWKEKIELSLLANDIFVYVKFTLSPKKS